MSPDMRNAPMAGRGASVNPHGYRLVRLPLITEAHAKKRAHTERLAWLAHQRAVELADADPNGVSFALRRAATAEWQRHFVALP